MKVIYEREREKDRGGVARVNRGGSWFSDARYCRAAIRYWDAASWRYRNLGFQPLIRIRDRGLG